MKRYLIENHIVKFEGRFKNETQAWLFLSARMYLYYRSSMIATMYVYEKNRYGYRQWLLLKRKNTGCKFDDEVLSSCINKSYASINDFMRNG